MNVHMGGHPTYGLRAAVEFHQEAFKGKAETPDWDILEDCCPFDLFRVSDDSIEWDRDKCTGCSSCSSLMAGRGIFHLSVSSLDAVDAGIADACLATVKAVGRDKVGFINMAIDVSPRCDCANPADMPIVPHLGVFAS